MQSPPLRAAYSLTVARSSVGCPNHSQMSSGSRTSNSFMPCTVTRNSETARKSGDTMPISARKSGNPGTPCLFPAVLHARVFAPRSPPPRLDQIDLVPVQVEPRRDRTIGFLPRRAGEGHASAAQSRAVAQQRYAPDALAQVF